jgi:hypothetical protein
MSFNSQVNYSWKSDHLINWFSSQITRLLKHPRNCICPLSDSVRLIPSNIVIICSHSSTSLFPKFLLRDKFHSLCAKFASDPPWSRESYTGLDIESLETFLNAHIFPKSCLLPDVMWGRTYMRRKRARDVRRAAERADRSVIAARSEAGSTDARG